MDFPVEYTAMASALMPLAVQYLKKFLPKIDPRILAGALSGVLGLAYAVFQQYAPEEIVLKAGAIASIAFGAGTVLYKAQKPSH